MLERITTQPQVEDLYTELSLENNWYWWTEGAYPDYVKFEDWIRGCANDAIGLFINKYKVSKDSYRLLGFSRFSRTSVMHGFSYLTIWTLPSLRKQRGLVPHGVIAAAEAINFAFMNYPLRKIYQNIVSDNVDSLQPVRKVSKMEGILKDHYFIDGSYRDLLTFSITREEWNIFYGRYRKKLESYF